MRGALSCHPHNDSNIRIIPADAGSTLAASLASSWGADHPRGCGEHVLFSRLVN